MRISSATSYNQRRAIVCAQSSSFNSTNGAQRYSSSARSNASASASSDNSSYTARAWPISFCAIDENATSSSSIGAIPVHSELRQPRINSSSANSSSLCAFTSLGEFVLQRIPVDAVVVLVELVDEVLDRVYGLARDDPQRDGLAAAAELLARVVVREGEIGRLDRAGVREGLASALLTEDLVNHAAWARSACRTH